MRRALLPVAFLVCALSPALQAKSVTLHVAPNGNDAWSGRAARSTSGGQDGPLASLAKALETARALRGSDGALEHVTIRLRGGVYELSDPILLRPEDSGASADRPLTIEAYRNERVVLSGGRRITGCKRLEAKPGLWQAQIPSVREGKWYFRQLFINGRRQQRARTPNQGFFTAQGDYLQENTVRFRFRAGDTDR